MTAGNKIKEFDFVVLTEDIARGDRKASKGEAGTVVHVHEVEGKIEAYEVEFRDEPFRWMTVPVGKLQHLKPA